MPLTVIEQTSWVVAWDQARARHVYLRDCDVAFCESGFIYVGPRFEGNAQNRMCGRGRMLMPGFVDIHSHPTTEPLRRGITDETTSPGFHHSSLYEFLPVLEGDEEARAACIKVALAELLKSGVTTLVDLSIPYEGWLDALADSGIRACIAPMYRDARWSTPNGHSIDYEWDAARGRASFDNAARLIERARQHPSGRLDWHALPGANRHLHGRAPAGQSRPRRRAETAIADPCGAECRRVSRDVPPARQDAGSVARRRSACSTAKRS